MSLRGSGFPKEVFLGRWTWCLLSRGGYEKEEQPKNIMNILYTAPEELPSYFMILTGHYEHDSDRHLKQFAGSMFSDSTTGLGN